MTMRFLFMTFPFGAHVPGVQSQSVVWRPGGWCPCLSPMQPWWSVVGRLWRPWCVVSRADNLIHGGNNLIYLVGARVVEAGAEADPQ
jgi:hypothetical protein